MTVGNVQKKKVGRGHVVHREGNPGSESTGVLNDWRYRNKASVETASPGVLYTHRVGECVVVTWGGIGLCKEQCPTSN